MIRKSIQLSAFALVLILTAHYGTAKQTSRQTLPPEYQKWLNEDVHWIISAQETTDFLKLTNDQARDCFVVDFWQRHNPNPSGKENTFKEEHYRRLAFSNQHFASGVPGWETDRGHIYIVYGPPDSITKHAAEMRRPAEEIWNYAHSQPAAFKFVDRCSCGDFELVSNYPKN